jgi:hypothetical protein
MPLHQVQPDQSVETRLDGNVVVLTIRGCLDASAGVRVVRAAEAAVEDEARRLDIDLRDVTGFTTDGARALVTCRGLLTGLPEGLHYRTGKGAGRAALLAAYADGP